MPPKVNIDLVPREIVVKAGKNIEVDIPYTGEMCLIEPNLVLKLNL